jgi:hypothetical protein
MMQRGQVISIGRIALLIVVPGLLTLSGCWVSSVVGPVDQAPSVTLVPGAGQLVLYNKGDADLQLWGDKLEGFPPDIDEKARIITSGGFYSFSTDRLRAVLPPTVDHEHGKLVPFEVYLSDVKGRNYVAKFYLSVKMTSGNMTIHTQQLGLRLANGFKGSPTPS